MKKHILLIDDDEDELQIFMAALQDVDTPCKCTYANSAEQALEMLQFLTPDMIFLDFNMPKINGLKCLTEIRKSEKTKSIPVILYSNWISSETNSQAAKLGVSACINKPSRMSTFSNILKDILNNQHVPISTSQNSLENSNRK